MSRPRVAHNCACAGPLAQLFTGVFEQNYLAHAVSYAACTGPLSNMCPFRTSTTGLASGGAAATSTAATAILVAACAWRLVQTR